MMHYFLSDSKTTYENTRPEKNRPHILIISYLYFNRIVINFQGCIPIIFCDKIIKRQHIFQEKNIKEYW